jgi:NitT/TauT family transport system permease protein
VKVRGLVVPLVLLMAWVVATHLFNVEPLVLPPPERVAKSIGQLLASNYLWLSLSATFGKAVAGLVLGALFGIPLGLLCGFLPTARAYLGGTVDWLRSIPATALYPLFALWLGFEVGPKIAIIAHATGLLMFIHALYGAQDTPLEKVEVCRSFGATSVQVFCKVVMPSAMTHVVASLRVMISLALVIAVVTEMFVGSEIGLGRMLYEFRAAYRTDRVIAGLVLLGTMGYLLNLTFLAVEQRLPWLRREWQA